MCDILGQKTLQDVPISGQRLQTSDRIKTDGCKFPRGETTLLKILTFPLSFSGKKFSLKFCIFGQKLSVKNKIVQYFFDNPELKGGGALLFLPSPVPRRWR